MPNSSSTAQIASAGKPRLEPEPLTRPRLRPIRHALQQRSKLNVRRHGWRSFERVLILLVLDATTVLLLSAAADAVRRMLGTSELGEAWRWAFPQGFLGGGTFYIALLIGLAIMGSFGRGDARRSLRRIYGATSLATGMVLWSAIWSHGVLLTAIQFAAVATSTMLAIGTGRLALDRYLHMRKRGRGRIPTLIAGPLQDCAALMSSDVFNARSVYRPVGCVTPSGSAPFVLGDLGHLAEVIGSHGIETVFVCGHLTDQDFANLVDTCQAADCELLSYPRALVAAAVHPGIGWLNGIPLIQLHRPELKAWQLMTKRVFDIIASGFLLLLLAPFIAGIALLVLMTSGRPIFFSQLRVGIGGRPFRIYKFRSMQKGAEHQLEELQKRNIYGDARLFKATNDPRVTRFGAFLRRSSIDELPQLLNVLKGDMSLVGPRPPRPEEVALYEEHHYCRFDVRPGITGPWQVRGRNLVTDFEEVVRLEQDYIRRWSVLHDLRILVETIPAVLTARGAH